MIGHLLRRLTSMAVTLFGVTVLVFLLGRLLPAPSSTGGPASVISDRATRQWFEQRYGLDRPLYEQYMRWWRGMFTVERDVLLWTRDVPARPVYVSGDEGGFVVRDADDQWTTFEIESRSSAMELETSQVQAALSADDRLQLLQRWPDHDRAPRHEFVSGSTGEPVDGRSLRRAAHRIEEFRLTLGRSRLTHATVMDEIERRLPVTLTLGAAALALTYLLAVPLGVFAAVRRGRAADRMIHVATMVAWSVPMVVSGTLLLGIAAGGGAVAWFPAGGSSSIGAESWAFGPWLMDRLWHLALPVLVLAVAGTGYVTRHVRSAVAEQLARDYVRTAHAKGLSGRAVVTRHVLRNAAIPVVTLLATVLPVLLGGSIIVEAIFGIEGMGRFVYRAALNRDYDVVQSFTLIAAAANMAGLLIADGLCMLLDPRIRLAGGPQR